MYSIYTSFYGSQKKKRKNFFLGIFKRIFLFESTLVIYRFEVAT